MNDEPKQTILARAFSKAKRLVFPNMPEKPLTAAEQRALDTELRLDKYLNTRDPWLKRRVLSWIPGRNPS